MITDVVLARTLIDDAAAGLAGGSSLHDVLAAAGEAVRVAVETGNPALTLDALLIRAQALTALGEATPEDWPKAALALRMQVMRLLDDHAPDAAAPAARLGAVAAANAMPADLGWAEAVRAEIAMVAGRWDDAHTIAMRAVTTASRAKDISTVLRAWHVVIPMAAERADDVRLSLAFYAYGRRPPGASAYARLLDAAAAVRFAAAGLAQPVPLAPADLLGAFEGAAAMPHWLAAVETIVEHWIASGENAAAGHALEKMSGSRASGLGAGVEALLRARLLTAEGAPEAGVAAQAWHALDVFSKVGAPWWIAKAIRALDGAAPQTLRTQAKRIEQALRIRGTGGVA